MGKKGRIRGFMRPMLRLRIASDVLGKRKQAAARSKARPDSMYIDVHVLRPLAHLHTLLPPDQTRRQGAAG